MNFDTSLEEINKKLIIARTSTRILEKILICKQHIQNMYTYLYLYTLYRERYLNEIEHKQYANSYYILIQNIHMDNSIDKSVLPFTTP